MKHYSDEDLVQLVVDKDHREAYNELVTRYRRGVFALLRRMLGRNDELEDIAQNVFLAAYRGLPAFKGKAKFGTWIYRIAYNHACSALRQIRSRSKHEVSASRDEEQGQQPEHEDKGAVGQEDETLRRQVWEAVDGLPSGMRAAVELYYGQGLQYPEIAQVLDLPLGTVKTHLFRARAQLRQALLGEEQQSSV